MSDNERVRVHFTAAKSYRIESINSGCLNPGDTIAIYSKTGIKKQDGTIASVGHDGKGTLTLTGEVLMEAGDFLVLESKTGVDATVKIWDDEDGPDTKPTCDTCGEELEPCTAVYCAQERHMRCPDWHGVGDIAQALGCCGELDCILREVRRLKKLAEVREWR